MTKNKLLCLLILIPAMAGAYQRLPVQEGDEVNAVIGAGLNRIAVEDDKIINVKGTHGDFVLDKDDELGQVYLQPTVEAKDKAIHLYVSTEKGNTYALNLTAVAASPESIVLIPAVEKTIDAQWEKSSTYEDSLKDIVKAMHTQSFQGYNVEKAKIKLPKVQDVQVTHLQSYIGPKLLGEVLEVKNTLNEEILLDEVSFYWEGVRAVSIVDKALAPKGTTRVYLVRG